MRLQIPAPDANDVLSIFLGDDETVDPTKVTALLTAMNASDGVSDPDGLGATAWVYLRGYLKRAKTRRKFSPGWATESGGD
jgi:hypothetical protein